MTEFLRRCLWGEAYVCVASSRIEPIAYLLKPDVQ